MAQLTKPDRIVWCDGSEEEKKRLLEVAVAEKVLEPLNQEKLPGCYLHRSNPNDVARVEHLTFICTPTKDEAGPTNNWMEPNEAYAQARQALRRLDEGPHDVRRAVHHGPGGLADVEGRHRAHRQHLRRAQHADHDAHGQGRARHARATRTTSTAASTRRSTATPSGASSATSRRTTRSGRSAPATAATSLLGKKCLALRIGSYLGKKEGWLAEHMLILGVESPEGEMTYVAAAFPSACGKTNFAMMIPPKRFKGWKIWTVGDDIAWMRVGDDGRLYAVNPENGLLRRRAGHELRVEPERDEDDHARHHLHERRAHAGRRRVVGGQGRPRPRRAHRLEGQPLDAQVDGEGGAPELALHGAGDEQPRGSRSSPTIPQGVPISAIIFGGRRATTVPLVMQAFNWVNGVFFGATLGSETTAAATGKVGVVRRDPLAMLPFCGYNMGDYFQHWLRDAVRRSRTRRRSSSSTGSGRARTGKFLWPGFGENMRVLKWVVDRARLRVGGQETSSAGSPRPATSISRASTSRTTRSTRRRTSTSTSGRRRSSPTVSSSRSSAPRCRVR